MIVLTSPGSCLHSPSTKNLYWCSPSGKSIIVTKSPWLFTIGNVFHPVNVPLMYTCFPPPSHLKTVGSTLLSATLVPSETVLDLGRCPKSSPSCWPVCFIFTQNLNIEYLHVYRCNFNLVWCYLRKVWFLFFVGRLKDKFLAGFLVKNEHLAFLSWRRWWMIFAVSMLSAHCAAMMMTDGLVTSRITHCYMQDLSNEVCLFVLFK